MARKYFDEGETQEQVQVRLTPKLIKRIDKLRPLLADDPVFKAFGRVVTRSAVIRYLVGLGLRELDPDGEE